MKKKQDIMGMPIVVEINDDESNDEAFEEVFSYFRYIDEKFSTYKPTSEISAINNNAIGVSECSDDMKEVLRLSDETKNETNGYFDIKKLDGTLDPSGLVKGWSILKTAHLLKLRNIKNFYIEAGGDIEVSGLNSEHKPWRIGIENPFKKPNETAFTTVKTLYLSDVGIATSGTYKRGAHIYDPVQKKIVESGVASLTVIGPNVYEADRFATAAFAMGKEGIYFIERLHGFEGYQIENDGTATMTTGFSKYTKESYA